MPVLYVLKDELNQIRYCGQTVQKLNIRLNEHLSRSKSKKDNDHKNCWIRSMLKVGLKPTIHFVNWVELQSTADELEKIYIKFYRDNGYKLTNWADGGKGPNLGKKWTEERRKNHIKFMKGKKYNLGKHHTKETKEKMSIIKSGENNYWYGKHLSEEHKKKISEMKKNNNLIKDLT